MTRTLNLTLYFVIGSIIASAPVAAQDPYSTWKFGDPAFNPPAPERFELANGLIVYFLPDTQLPVITMTAIVRAGEVYAPDGKVGLGGITGEALVTGGTKSKSPDQVDEQLEFLGIRWEGSVGMESAEFSMQTLKKDWNTAIDLFADLLLHPAFEQSRLQLAIDNTIEDVRRENDSPGRIIRREFAKLAYGSHPYGRSATAATLAALTRTDVQSYYDQYFRSDRTILAFSGDIPGGTSLERRAMIETLFSAWQKAESALPEVPSPETSEAGVYQIEKDISQTNIRFGHLGIDRHNPDRHAVRVLNHILGSGGFTSRMVATVRSDSGWAYSVGTAFSTAKQPGLFYASSQTKTETTSKAIALMQWVIEDLRNNGIREAELTTAKESILNSDVFNYDTPVEVVENYAWQEYNGFASDQLKLDMAAIKTLTKADVDAAAQKYLFPGHYVILAVGKIDGFDAPLTKFGDVRTIILEDTP